MDAWLGGLPCQQDAGEALYYYYAILYYTILYYTKLYYAILYYTKLNYAILYYTILYFTHSPALQTSPCVRHAIMN